MRGARATHVTRSRLARAASAAWAPALQSAPGLARYAAFAGKASRFADDSGLFSAFIHSAPRCPAGVARQRRVPLPPRAACATARSRRACTLVHSRLPAAPHRPGLSRVVRHARARHGASPLRMPRAAALGPAAPRRSLTAALALARLTTTTADSCSAVRARAAVPDCAPQRAAGGSRHAPPRLASAIRASAETDAVRAAPPAPQRKSSAKRSVAPCRPATPTCSGAPAASPSPRCASAAADAPR